MNRIAHFLILSVVLTGICFDQSRADLTYAFDFEQDTYLVTQGEAVSVKLFLTEVATDGETPRLAAGGDDGLFGFDGSIDYSQSTPSGSNVSFDSAAAGPGFQDFASGAEAFLEDENQIVSFQTAQLGNVFNGVSGDRISDSIYVIELGTFTFNASTSNSTTTLQLVEWNDAAEAGFVFADGFEAPVTFGSAQIVTVPEPSVMILATMLGGGLFIRRRR